MKKFLAPLLLCALTFGTLPVLADFSFNFGRHSSRHDNRWSYNDFQNANSYYYRQHPNVVVVPRRDLRRHFDQLDRNHSGYITIQQAQGYRVWQ